MENMHICFVFGYGQNQNPNWERAGEEGKSNFTGKKDEMIFDLE